MIDARGLTFGYQAGSPIIDQWSGSIARGEMAAIVGPSGCGKSTLLFLLGTLVRPWSGQLRLDGVRVDHLNDSKRSEIRAALIGFVFQDALLDARRTVVENVIEGAIYRGDDRRDAVRGAEELLGRLAVDVEPNRSAVHLSGGQAQRVALCRALLSSPSLVLADEPTGNLDQASAETVERLLRGVAAGGSAIVVATHDMALASRCDRTIRL